MLKYLVLFFVIIFSVEAQTQSDPRLAIPWSKLKTGDLLLISLQCRVCQLIELEEGEPFSHMALVIKNKNKISLVESWGADGIKLKTPKEFWLDKVLNVKNPLVIIRHATQFKNRPQLQNLESFLPLFLGKKYDPHFLWDNTDVNKQPLYYCSEFLYKILKLWLTDNLILKTKKMTYTKYYSNWVKYFDQYRQAVPAGLEGISPADFVKSKDFKIIFNAGGYWDQHHGHVHE